MALKFSEMSALRVDLARNLEAGFDNYLGEIAGGYGAFVAPLLEEGETAPDIRFQLELLKRGVAQGRQRIQNLNSGVVEQSHDGDRVRAELELRQSGVDAKLRLVRHLCRGFFGPEGIKRVGLQEEPPRGVPRLLDHAQTVMTSLENPALGLKPLLELETGEGVSTTQAQLAAKLEPELSELRALIDERHQENRKSTDVRLRRQRVIREFDTDVRAIVRIAQGMFRLAGRDDLAERFRPILRRVVRRINTAQAEEAADQEAEPTTSAEPTTGTEPENSETGTESTPATPAETPA